MAELRNNNSSELMKRFRVLSEHLSGLIEEEGWSVLPYLNSTLPYFRQLTLEQMQVAVRQLADYIQICQKARDGGHSVKSTLGLTQTALDYYSFNVHQEVMNLLTDQLVVEFYNLNHLQMFRTFNFFEKSSYSIEDLYCRPWFALFDREEHITEKLMELGMAVVMGDEHRPTKIPIREHFLTERASLQRLKAHVKSIWIAPLFKGEEKAGFVNIIDAQILGTLIEDEAN